MSEYLVFALLFVAIAIGWYLGRHSRSPRPATGEQVPSQYYRGFQYLLDGRHDGAIDAFIDALDVNSETLETHLALGNLLRQRGELARAIRIHQNLLGRRSLPRSQTHQAHLELARDYISAGLLDRAERLLLDLVDESPAQRRAGRRYLLDIYQSERDWERAIEVARALLPRKGPPGGTQEEAGEPGQVVPVILAHYHCELADTKRAAGDLDAARQLLQQALEHDRNCVRASLTLGAVERDAGDYRLAIELLHRVQQQDPDYVYETVPALRECYRRLGEEHQLRAWLRECVESRPSPPLVLALAEEIRAAEGLDAAVELLAGQLERMPSLRGVEKLIQLQASAVQGEQRERLDRLQSLVQRVLEQRPTYRCSHCGFAGRQLHWLCPGCRYWGTLKNIRGTGME